MSNQRADRKAIDDLPDFLADPTAAAPDAEPDAVPGECGLSNESDEDPAPEQEDAPEPEAGLEPPTAAEPVTPQARRRGDQHGTRAHQPKGSPGLVILSILCLGAGGVLGYAQGQGKLIELRDFGGTPATLLVAGIVCAVGANLRRHGAVDQTKIAAQLESEAATGDDLRASLAYLVSAQQAQAQRPPAAGEELQRVLLTLERHDEKINNLTKAMKMYGKPLMEIANQVADIGAGVTSTKTDVESVLEITRTGFTRIESDIEQQDVRKELESVHQQLKRVEEQVQKSVAGLGERMPRPDALPQFAERLETSVRSLAQRLEESSREQTRSIEKIARHDAAAANDKMTQQLEAAIQRLRTDLDHQKSGINLDALEASIREIQREVGSLATATAQIQSALRSGGGRAAAPAVQPAESPTPPAGTDADADAHAGVVQNKTGTRAASGKNVLGAIAKLKQMKQ
jgi:uncharacterized protein YoxC